MEPTKILFYRNLLLRCVVIGIGVAILLFLGTVLAKDLWMPMAMSVFNLEEQEVMEAVLSSLLHVRLIILFLFLTPALALHWMVKSTKS